MTLNALYELIPQFRTILYDRKKVRLMESTRGQHVNLVNMYLLKSLFLGEDSQ